MLIQRIEQHKGSALVESILVIGVLSLFLSGIPVLGALIDLKQSTVLASRYAAWERTVSGDTSELESRVDLRFFKVGGLESGSDKLSTGFTRLWKDSRESRWQHDSRIDTGVTRDASGLELTSHYPNSLSGTAYKGTGQLMTNLGRIGGSSSWQEGNPESDGLMVSSVKAGLSPSRWLRQGSSVIESTGILVDSWSAGDDSEIRQRVQGFVPSSRLSKLGDFVSKFKIIPMLGDLKNLEDALGCVKTNIVPGKEFTLEEENAGLKVYGETEGDKC